MSIFSSDKKSLKSKIADELKTLLVLTLYFAVFFVALNYFKFSILQKVNVAYDYFGLSLIRAVVCAKFMMVGKTLYPIKVTPNKPLVWHIINRSLVYLLIVIGLNIIEEMLVAKIHGEHIWNSIVGIQAGTINQFFALAILYWIVLIPYVTYSAVSQFMGGVKIYQLIFVNGNIKEGSNV